MRKDFPKLSYKWKHKHSNKDAIRTRNTTKRDSEGESLPKQMSHVKCAHDVMGPHYYPEEYGWGPSCKYINRFLKKNIGQEWNDIYSEFCEVTKGKRGIRLRKLLVQSVDFYPKKQIDGYFYVDDFPEFGGKLRFTPSKKYRRKKDKSKIVRIGDKSYFKHDDIWYRVTLEKYNKSDGFVNDAFMGAVGDDRWWVKDSRRSLMAFYGESVYCVKRECANSTEIKKIKLDINQ